MFVSIQNAVSNKDDYVVYYVENSFQGVDFTWL